MKKKQTTKNKSVLTIIISIITGLLFILAAYIFISGLVARNNNSMASIFGYTYSVVPTNSMEPDIKVGDSVIGKKVKYDKLKIGDDIIYYSKENNIFIVHRIISYDKTKGFLCQGINNPGSDNEYVTKDNYIAKVVWNGSLANIGSFIISSRGFILVILSLAILVIGGNAGIEIYKVMKIKKQQEEIDAAKKLPTEEEIRQQVLKELEEEKNKFN